MQNYFTKKSIYNSNTPLFAPQKVALFVVYTTYFIKKRYLSVVFRKKLLSLLKFEIIN